MNNKLPEFYRDKTVLITGHMGFKGTWLTALLVEMGAKVIGYGLDNEVRPSVFAISNLEEEIISVEGDVCNFEHLQRTFQAYQPQVVFHLAAQPIVRTSYEDPVGTYQTNVMGTVHVLECVRLCESVKSLVNVTTDKVYLNREMDYAYVETDILNGFDPYSNSKSCSELVTSSYRNAFFQKRELGISTARAGNVLGGGDFSKDRIMSDCVRCKMLDQTIIIRNPESIRPYQYVLDALYAYLLIGASQYGKRVASDEYNVGPRRKDCVTTRELVELFCKEWEGAKWESQLNDGPHEAGYLKLNSGKIEKKLGYQPIFSIQETVKALVIWSKAFDMGEEMQDIMKQQVRSYLLTRNEGVEWKE